MARRAEDEGGHSFTVTRGDTPSRLNNNSSRDVEEESLIKYLY